MAIVYRCRHCGQVVGEVNQQMVDEAMLGLDKLSAADKQDMIDFQENGEVQIKTICESCEASLGANPHYHELDFFIQ